MANEILWNGEDVLEDLWETWGVERQISGLVDAETLDGIFEDLRAAWQVQDQWAGLVDVETLDGIFEDLRAAWHVEDQLFCPITSSKGRGGRSPVSRQITGE